MVHANRAFLARASHLGSRVRLPVPRPRLRIPGPGSVREAVQAAYPTTAVACVDWDRSVPHYAARLASDGVKNVVVITADITGPAAVLADPRVTEVIDLAEPVCVVLGLVLHYTTADQAREVTTGYARQLTPGSIMVFTMPRFDERAAVRPDPRGVHPRSAAQSHPLRRHLVLRRAGSHPPGRATGHGVPAGVGRRPGGPGRAYVIGGIGRKP